MFTVSIRNKMGIIPHSHRGHNGLSERAVHANRCDHIRRVHVAADRPHRDDRYFGQNNHHRMVWRRQDTVSLQAFFC